MKRIALTALAILISLCIKSQNANNFQKMVDFLPPAPNASSIIKHADLNLNKNTGSPAINIPLFEVKGRKLSVGISIGYSSTGIKVDEIASRVGMGWSLSAGGVITRTVRGSADEFTTRITPPFAQAGQNCGTYAFMETVSNSGPETGRDAEPDLFNFNMNGISGSFIFDANMNPVFIPLEKYKLEKNFSSTAWNFKITTTDGIAYYFGGENATEKTKRNNTCGKNFANYMATAWYLIKVEHPNGEVINLTYTPLTYTYETGVSETQNWAFGVPDPRDVPVGIGLSCPIQECPTAPVTPTCVNLLTTQGVLLNTISSANESVSFTYGSRSDCQDKLVASVQKYVNNQPAGLFYFTYNQQHSDMSYVNANIYASGYDYTPYLTVLQERSSDLFFTRTHQFFYDDPGARPNRLSFAQDHWGYFNGKVNSTFIPRPKEFYLQQRFPLAVANREPDPVFARKGMLIKIIYPTGGIDSIAYEGNEAKEDIPAFSTYHEYVCNVTGAEYWDSVVKTTTFTIDHGQVVELDITSSTLDPNAYDSVHQKGGVSVSGPNNFYWSESFFQSATPYVRFLNPSWSLPAGTYTLTYCAKGEAQTTTVKLKYYPTTHTPSSNNRIVGGVRVKRVMTGNPGENPVIKKYYYGSMDELDVSSLYYTPPPVYNKDYEIAHQCEINGGGGGQSGHVNIYCQLTAMYSSSLTNLFDYGSALVSYGFVVEGIGENFEGGATQYTFNAHSDSRGYVWTGREILGAPLNNSSSPLNGKLKEEIVFKKPATGPLFPVRKTTYDYMLDTSGYTNIFGYTVNKRYEIAEGVPFLPCADSSQTIVPQIINAFDVMQYYNESWWMHLRSQTETVYDENGQNPVTSTTNFYFDNAQHLQLTRTTVTNSKGQVINTTNQYPGDITGNQVYTDMVNKNIITPLVHTSSEIQGNPATPLSEQWIDYGNAGNNNYVPIEVRKAVKGNALESEGTINAYDPYGNILQFTGKNGITTSVIWGYDYRYPVAQIVGATYASAVAQLTGGSVTALQSMDGATLRTEINLIRTNIPSASVTTYTYKPMAGVTSITDPNNKTNTYDYDSFNRLLTIKDQDGNVVKKNEYVYTTTTSGSTLHVFFNDERIKSYSCQTCEYGYTSNGVVNYRVEAGKYFSLISKEAAEAMAAADTDGQEYANIHGSCINPVNITCTGAAYRIVNCVCELGTKQCISTQDNGGGSYTITYRYHWTDGTTSASTYTETISCSGVDKKMINCVCETGTRVCESVVDNGGGSYTLTYHYLWSDASTSSQIVETINCSGPDKKIINCTCVTGTKVYTSSVLTNKFSNNGCAVGEWKCTFYYRWPDNSTSLPTYYTECAAASCLLIEE